MTENRRHAPKAFGPPPLYGRLKSRNPFDIIIHVVSSRRRHPEELSMGNALAFRQVPEVEHRQRLVVLADMIFPGEALPEFRLIKVNGG